MENNNGTITFDINETFTMEDILKMCPNAKVETNVKENIIMGVEQKYKSKNKVINKYLKNMFGMKLKTEERMVDKITLNKNSTN